ncbi:hypothetical protein J7M22_07660 [Candidatus Poribacteria bacterium]|nr:hypothetical protein [Candidatus Poribacteria bacterium]
MSRSSNSNGSNQEFYQWLDEAFFVLPRSNELFFQRLWQEGRLNIDPSLGSPDIIDERSARLICATLHRRERLLIVLPNASPHRPPLLFATGLLMYALDTIGGDRNICGAFGRGLVLYFGSTVGIRQHLVQTKAGRINLASVFPQVYRTRSGTYQASQQLHEETNLPTVICVYSPVDPISVIKQHQPDWIAIDCGEKSKLHWLPPLLEFTRDHNLPVIAWCQNPLSLCIEDFLRTGALVFRWPYIQQDQLLSSLDPPDGSNILEQIFNHTTSVCVQPILVKDGNFLSHLQNAYYNLVDTSRIAVGRLARDALYVGWSYLRTLESLHVPLDIYESEAKYHWA